MIKTPNDLLTHPQPGSDVVFINPAHHGPDYYSPIGINMLAHLARQAGFSVAILDFQRKIIGDGFPWPEGFLAAAELELSRVTSKVFAFSVMNVGFPWAVELAAIVKRLHPNATIVFGGPHATLLGPQILEQYKQIDIVATNEGEGVIVPLLTAVCANDRSALVSCPNLLIRENDNRVTSTTLAPFLPNLDVLPMMALDEKLLSTIGMLSVEAGRGCPYRCKFCSSHAIWTRKPRFKSPKRLIDEVLTYVAACPPREEPLVISLEHDDFLSNRPLFREFAEQKIRCGATFRYGITTRLNHLSDEVIDLLAASGCVSVFMGLETGSEVLQQSSAKFLRLPAVMPTLLRLSAQRIHMSTNFIVGFPDETYDDVVASFAMMFPLAWLGCSINISMMCPEPGSEIHQTTPEERYHLLADSTVACELRRGGIEPSCLKEVARYHLLTIQNANYDIAEMARLCRSMQFLMTDFPFVVYALNEHFDGDTSRVMEYVRSHPEVLTIDTIASFISDLPVPAWHSRVEEFVNYELSKAHVKRGFKPLGKLSDFSSDMPDVYYRQLYSAVHEATLVNVT